MLNSFTAAANPIGKITNTAAEIFKTADENGDDSIDAGEFANVAASLGYEAFDIDGDGDVTMGEIFNTARRIFQTLDENGDDSIDASEFENVAAYLGYDISDKDAAEIIGDVTGGKADIVFAG